MKSAIRLDKNEISEKIKRGDVIGRGSYVLAVSPDGTESKVHWMERNCQWDPWPDCWLTIGIPALFPDGRGDEYELATDCLLSNGLDPDEIEEEIEESWDFEGLIAYAGAKFPEWMEAARDNALDFLLDAFLSACNGDGTELNDPAPWGYIYDEYGGPETEREPPADFEWK